MNNRAVWRSLDPGARMKAEDVFDSCYARYRSLHEWLDDTRGKVRANDVESPSSGYSWRPARGRACEYMADFEGIGPVLLCCAFTSFGF